MLLWYTKLKVQLLSKSLNTILYFTQPPYHPSFSVFSKILKSYMILMHLVSFQNNSIFYNSYIKCVEQGVFRIERLTFSRYYVANLEKCEIVFKLLASNCIYLVDTRLHIAKHILQRLNNQRLLMTTIKQMIKFLFLRRQDSLS